MRVDPSVLFSMIFIPEEYFTDWTEDELVTLDYTYLGNVKQVVYKGVWADVVVHIPHHRALTDYTEVDLTIFVAIGFAPESGLDGILSISVTPSTDDWYLVSLMGRIEEKYAWNTIYVEYSFPRKHEYYLG